MFLPGEADAGAAAKNNQPSIDADPSKHVLIYATEAERDQPVRDALVADGKDPVNPRQWYQQYEQCNFGNYDTDVVECDEYPFYTSTRGGPPAQTPATPWGSRIELVPKLQNRAEGTAYSAFLTVCHERVRVDREPYLVVPRVGANAAPTDFVCRR